MKIFEVKTLFVFGFLCLFSMGQSQTLFLLMVR